MFTWICCIVLCVCFFKKLFQAFFRSKYQSACKMQMVYYLGSEICAWYLFCGVSYYISGFNFIFERARKNVTAFT